jgi:hypothetical protein
MGEKILREKMAQRISTMGINFRSRVFQLVTLRELTTLDEQEDYEMRSYHPSMQP